jgi:arylsulfatase A-like enzyme
MKICLRQKVKCFCFLIIQLISFGLMAQSSNSNSLDLPNIVFILADDLGYGDVSCYNKNSKILTPNIDRIAESGITFTDAHSSSAVCTPTRYGILTGRYNWRSWLKQGVLGVYDNPLMDPGRINMGIMLKKKGYQTACIGKWHLGRNWPTTNNRKPVNIPGDCNLDFSKPITGGPLNVGFDYYFGTDVPNYPPYCFIENQYTIGIPSEFYAEHLDKDCRPGIGIPEWKLTEILPTLLQRVIKYIKDASKKNEPFFLYFPLTAPHTPITPSEEFQGKSGLNAYADFVMEVDFVVSEVLDVLEESRESENTIIVFTSDNGCSPKADFSFLEQKGHDPSYIYRGQKADLYEGGHRIPCLVQWPAKIKTAHTVEQTICLNDFMATFAEIVGCQLQDNEAEDSYNILPLLLNPKYKQPIREATVHHSVDGSFAIRKGVWKLILAPGSGGWSYPRPGKDDSGLPPVQLYNLKTDPEELSNVYDTHQKVVNELKSLLKTYIEDGRSTPGTPQKNDGEYPWKQASDIVN